MKHFFGSFGPFLKYWLQCEDQYSQQSPFAYSIYSGLLEQLKNQKSQFQLVENYRKSLLSDRNSIRINDFGAGSKRVNQPFREIRKIAKYSSSNPKFARLYHFFCQLTPAEFNLELGTCLGISTRYLDLATKGKLWTIEGAEELWRISQSEPKPKRTEFILGEITSILPEILEKIPSLDFALIDANHTYQGTKFAFEMCLAKIHEKSILILADIHWSKDMTRAWEEIKEHPKVKLSMDFFECGVLFFDYDGPKNHLVLSL